MKYDIVVASTPRSGGNWFLRLLHERGLPMGGEWLHPGNRSAAEEAYDESRVTGHPFINKVHANEFWEYGLELKVATDGLRPVKYIHLVRTNTVDQAESWIGAQTTGNWFDGSTRGIAKPDAKHIQALLDMNDWWEDQLPSGHLHVIYEELVDHTDKEMDRVMEWLGYNRYYDKH